MLAAAVTLAGVACACAVPAIDVDGSDAVSGTHHAHHADGHADHAAGCDHVECGDCTANGAVSKPDALRDHVPQLPNLPLDYEVESPSATAFAAVSIPPWHSNAHHPPLPRLLRTADTAVRRFDKLLN